MNNGTLVTMAKIAHVISGNLPHQSSVYVIFAVRERLIHVFSTEVSSRFTVVREQLSECYIETPDEDQQFLEDAAVRLGVNNSADKAGFYNGVSSSRLGLFESVCERGEHTYYETIDCMVPYACYSLPTAKVVDIIGTIPAVEEGRTFGSVEYQGGGGDVAVSINLRPRDYIVCKIDQVCDLLELELENGNVFIETMLSSEWSEEDMARICSRAIFLVQALALRDGWGCSYYEEVHPEIYQIILEETGSENRWGRRQHKHIVVGGYLRGRRGAGDRVEGETEEADGTGGGGEGRSAEARSYGESRNARSGVDVGRPNSEEGSLESHESSDEANDEEAAVRERYKLLCIKSSGVVPFNIVYEGE